jgi:hypothetical protein
MPRLCVAFLSLVVFACAGPSKGEITFPAAYFRSGESLPPAVPSCTAPIQVVATDARPTPSVVGRRFEEEKPTVEYPIKMQGDAGAYVRNGVEKALQAAGGAPAGKAPANLAITITQIAVEEKTFYNAEFTGRMGLEVVLTRPTSSEPCWSGRVSGSGRNYGKAGNPTNYQETLNRALDDATAQLLRAPGFADALCGKCSS